MTNPKTIKEIKSEFSEMCSYLEGQGMDVDRNLLSSLLDDVEKRIKYEEYGLKTHKKIWLENSL